MPPDKLTLSSNTIDGEEGLTLVPARKQSARIIPLTRQKTRTKHELLTHPIKVALQIILEDGKVMQRGHFWYGAGSSRIAYQTVEAMFARYLVKIVVESRHRRKQIAELTELGFRIARDLKREREEDTPPSGRAQPLTEASARFIHSIVDDGCDKFEDATLVYGDGDACTE